MIRTLLVAIREFKSTVFTKGFILGVLMTPVMLILVVVGVQLLINLEGPRVEGRLAVVDQAGGVAERVRYRFTEEGIASERIERARAGRRMVQEGARVMGTSEKDLQAAKGMVPDVPIPAEAREPDLRIETLPADADIDRLKEELARAEIRSPAGAEGGAPLLAIVVIPPGAVRPEAGAAAAGAAAAGAVPEYAPLRLYTTPKLDIEIQSRIRGRVGQAVVDARLASEPRVASSGLSAPELRAILAPPASDTLTVTADGERQSVQVVQFLIPLGFMMLLLLSVFTAGQYLLTSTIEEKSSRVMEVLLSAVSPMQLMVGKVLGQMAVGLLMLVVYSGLGLAALLAFASAYLPDPWSLLYLMIYFMLAFFTIASMMAAVGSAVTDMREAQTLLTPIMLMMFIPWMLWMPIQRAPNSTLSLVLSFIPGVNPFVMVIRIAGAEPVPFWQIPASIAVGLATAVFMAWAAAKIFRIGILMYGKPPDFRTLVRWIRMA